MNIRQFQIFQQDLTNFNILEIGKKDRAALLRITLFSLFYKTGFNPPVLQNRRPTELAPCEGRPKSGHSSGGT